MGLTPAERKIKVAKLKEETFELVKKLVDPQVSDLKAATSENRTDLWKKCLLAVLKKIKECARKEQKFEWALDHLNLLEDGCQDPSLKVSLNKIEEAKMEVKMDQHDNDVPVSQNPNVNI